MKIMKPSLKFYLKIFLLTGIPFALISLVFDLVDEVDINVGKFVFLSFFFGLAMSLTMGTLHRKRLKNITDKELNELGRGQWVVSGFTREYLNDLPYFHQKNFRDSAMGIGAFEPIKDDRNGTKL